MTAMPCGPATGIAGPAILEEREATTVIPPGDRLAVDDGLNLSITIGEGQKQIALVTPGTPRAEAVARLSVDPIGLEIMWARLAARAGRSTCSPRAHMTVLLTHGSRPDRSRREPGSPAVAFARARAHA